MGVEIVIIIAIACTVGGSIIAGVVVGLGTRSVYKKKLSKLMNDNTNFTENEIEEGEKKHTGTEKWSRKKTTKVQINKQDHTLMSVADKDIGKPSELANKFADAATLGIKGLSSAANPDTKTGSVFNGIGGLISKLKKSKKLKNEDKTDENNSNSEIALISHSESQTISVDETYGPAKVTKNPKDRKKLKADDQNQKSKPNGSGKENIHNKKLAVTEENQGQFEETKQKKGVYPNNLAGKKYAHSPHANKTDETKKKYDELKTKSHEHNKLHSKFGNIDASNKIAKNETKHNQHQEDENLSSSYGSNSSSEQENLINISGVNVRTKYKNDKFKPDTKGSRHEPAEKLERNSQQNNKNNLKDFEKNIISKEREFLNDSEKDVSAHDIIYGAHKPKPFKLLPEMRVTQSDEYQQHNYLNISSQEARERAQSVDHVAGKNGSMILPKPHKYLAPKTRFSSADGDQANNSSNLQDAREKIKICQKDVSKLENKLEKLNNLVPRQEVLKLEAKIQKDFRTKDKGFKTSIKNTQLDKNNYEKNSSYDLSQINNTDSESDSEYVEGRYSIDNSNSHNNSRRASEDKSNFNNSHHGSKHHEVHRSKSPYLDSDHDNHAKYYAPSYQRKHPNHDSEERDYNNEYNYPKVSEQSRYHNNRHSNDREYSLTGHLDNHHRGELHSRNEHAQMPSHMSLYSQDSEDCDHQFDRAHNNSPHHRDSHDFSGRTNGSEIRSDRLSNEKFRKNKEKKIVSKSQNFENDSDNFLPVKTNHEGRKTPHKNYVEEQFVDQHVNNQYHKTVSRPVSLSGSEAGSESGSGDAEYQSDHYSD